MEATELRIGNYVEYNGMSLTVVGISPPTPRRPDKFNEKWCIDLLCDGFITCTIDESLPIPLTEEWLLKLGFLKDHRKTSISILDTIYFVGYGLKLWEVIGGTRYRQEFYSDYMSGVNIDYVHTLQNFVFALTAKEIEVK